MGGNWFQRVAGPIKLDGSGDEGGPVTLAIWFGSVPYPC